MKVKLRLSIVATHKEKEASKFLNDVARFEAEIKYCNASCAQI